MDAKEVETLLEDCLIQEPAVDSIGTFEDCGVITRDKGIVVGFMDGTEFQITIVRSK